METSAQSVPFWMASLILQKNEQSNPSLQTTLVYRYHYVHFSPPEPEKSHQ